MLDLNTLIAPGSGFQLTNAFNINDRGEILAKAAPLGFTPNDDADLGHLVLLVPCDSGDMDCEGDAEGTTMIDRQSSAPITKSLATTTPLTPREKAAAWRARIARQYHILGTPKN
ncbi:MAG TPA: hypothetical protein VHT31_04940 [Candidatus Acidoferrum sp.]|jgi:hypothetical protein|nr:hypothetical protein [Candidatus Acidoferrum sp.]